MHKINKNNRLYTKPNPNPRSRPVSKSNPNHSLDPNSIPNHNLNTVHKPNLNHNLDTKYNPNPYPGLSQILTMAFKITLTLSLYTNPATTIALTLILSIPNLHLMGRYLNLSQPWTLQSFG